MIQGDTTPALQHQIFPTSVNLTGATVTFQMRRKSGKKVITDGTCVIDDIAERLVSYDWQAGDTDTPGEYIGQYRITLADSNVTTAPVIDDIPILIRPKI